MEPSTSIVIVCMNNMANLVTCIDSIKRYTSVPCEIWVVAYLFSPDNLAALREKYPEVKVVESNEIRGFAENNNLALRQITTEYTLVLNDDTEFREPVLDKLLAALQATPDASIVSPKLLNRDGSLQFCGRNPWTAMTFIRDDISIAPPRKDKVTRYTNQQGIFQTYNISGACFLIKQAVFKELGFFDERYFFCPEDIALSTLANEKGYKCYVNANATLYHYAGETRSKVKVATLPSQRKGCIIFFSSGNQLKRLGLETYCCVFSFLKSIYWLIKGNSFERKAQWHCVETAFSRQSPKEIFVKYYACLKK